MEHFSRAHREQIAKRVRKAGFRFDQAWKCLICGKQFRSSFCTHTVPDNVSAIEMIQKIS